jgi:arylsulfatase A
MRPIASNPPPTPSDREPSLARSMREREEATMSFSTSPAKSHTLRARDGSRSTPVLLMKRISLGLTILLALARLAPAATPSVTPNIIFILADDLGYGDLKCYNADSKIPTPALDLLAAQGIRFTDAHASDSLCSPSRYSLLTGRYCFRSRLKSGVLKAWDPPLIEQGRLTLPMLLRQHGYQTACIGKWHLGWEWPTTDGRPPSSSNGVGNVDFARPVTGGPTERGFDSYFGVDLPNFPPYCFIENNHSIGIPSLPAPMTKGGFNRPGPVVAGWNLTNILPEITLRATRLIENASKSEKPFFLYFPLTAPHYPVVPTGEFKGRSQASDYGDFVAQVDGTVQSVMDALARAHRETNTLIFFSSDNGPECVEIDPGAYERLRLFKHSSMDGLRGVKRDAWEGGHRVPFIARWPGHIPAGRVSEETICLVDLLATCASLLHAKPPADAAEDSYNILPVLLGEAHKLPLREATVLHSGHGNFGIRQGEWVLIDAPSGDDNGAHGEPPWFKKERGYQSEALKGELYNLRNDRAQVRNLYAEQPEIVQRLKQLLEKYKSDARSAPLH